MKKTIILAVLLGLAALPATADVVTYTGFDGTYTATGGNTTVTQALSTSPDHTWMDMNPSGGTGHADMYYAGTITMSGTDDWWDGFVFGLRSSVDGKSARIENDINPSSLIEFDGTAADADISEISGMNFTIAYQIKLVDLPWNSGRAHLFLGANATAASEGSSDYDVSFTNVTANPIDEFFLSIDAKAGRSTIATLSGTTSSTEWIVPEPATMMILAIGGIGVVLRRRKKA